MNILIFEDEQYNYDLLCQMLAEQIDDCHLYGPLTSITEGKSFFATNNERIDLIIADIQLNDGLSFYALTDAPSDIPIIFTTAYDEYALKAFEYNSLSYLLKPVDEDELHDAIRKTQERMITDEHREELFRLLSESECYRERFFVKTFRGEKVISITEIRYIVSEQKSTYLVLKDGSSYELDKSLSILEEELNPRRFMRVNRKYIIPADEVSHFNSGSNGKEQLILRGDNPPEIIVSRAKKDSVHKWLQ